MTHLILEARRKKGPLTMDQLAAETGAPVDELCDSVSFLMRSKKVYLEIDGSIWFVAELERMGVEA